MFKKLLLSILCLSTLSSQTAPWINAKLLYPFIAAQSAAAAGYYFNGAYRTHKTCEFQKRENEISKWISNQELISFNFANKFYKIPIQRIRNQNGDSQIKCQTLQNISDRLESKIHEAQKATKNKAKLVIIPTLSNKHVKKLLKQIEIYEKENKESSENILHPWIHNGFASSHGCIIQLPLKEIAKLHKLSNDRNKKDTQAILTENAKANVAYENHLQKIYAILGHELSHLENEDTKNKIVATATVPFATEGIWQIGAKLFKRKPSPTHLSSFQFLYKTVAQLPIGVAKFCLTGILLAYYKASQEYRCDRQSIEYMGRASTPAFIKWFESKADTQNEAIEDCYGYRLFDFYLTATRSRELFDKLKNESREANKSNDKQKIDKINNQLKSIIDRFRKFSNKIFPLNDSVINASSIMISGHPSYKYRAERLKKLLKQEEQK